MASGANFLFVSGIVVDLAPEIKALAPCFYQYLKILGKNHLWGQISATLVLDPPGVLRPGHVARFHLSFTEESEGKQGKK